MGLRGIEKFMPVLAGAPADINSAGITGDYVSFKNYRRCTVLCIMGDGTSSNDVDMLLYQATDADGGSAKVLDALETGRIYTMYGADFAAYAALTAWTKVTQATADEQYAPTDNGESVGIMALELQSTDLDVDNGFDWFRCDLSDPAASKVCALIYLFHDPAYQAGPESMKVPNA